MDSPTPMESSFDENFPIDPILIAKQKAVRFGIKWIKVASTPLQSWGPGFLSGFGLFLFLGGSILGPIAILIAFYISIRQVRERSKTVSSLIEILAPVLVKYPTGLENTDFGIEIMSTARLSPRTPRFSPQSLAEAAKWGTSPESPAFKADCSQGHSPICKHKVSSEALLFWHAIATSST
jgi:hypothetical protein